MICNCNQCYQLSFLLEVEILGRGGNTESILFADDESNFPKSNQRLKVNLITRSIRNYSHHKQSKNTGLKYVTLTQ